jgi:hypothetical protein
VYCEGEFRKKYVIHISTAFDTNNMIVSISVMYDSGKGHEVVLMFGWSHLSQEEYLEKRLREAGVSNEVIAALKTELLPKPDLKEIKYFSMDNGHASICGVNVSRVDGTVM